MSDKAKRLFIILSVAIPFFLYSVYYYSMVIKNAPYKFTEFKSIVFQYGDGDSLINRYNSKTGEYQYLNKRDSLIKIHVYLNQSELLYLHRKAGELGFWDFPANELNNDTTKSKGKAKPPRFVMEFNYQRKSKHVVFDSNYDGPEKLVDANERMIKLIQKVLNEAEQRNKK